VDLMTNFSFGKEKFAFNLTFFESVSLRALCNVGRVRCWFTVNLLGVISSTDCCKVIGQDISFVLVVGTGNSVVF